MVNYNMLCMHVLGSIYSVVTKNKKNNCIVGECVNVSITK